MDDDLKSIAAARRCAESAFEAYRAFLGTDPARIDEIVEAMARAVEPEAKRLGEIAVAETGYGNVPDKRVKNLFNALAVAEYLREVTTLGVLWRDDAAKVLAIGEPMGVVAALIPVTNPTSTVIYKVLSAVKAGNAIVCAPHPRGVKSGLETVRIMARCAEQMGAPKGLIQCLEHVTILGTAELMKHRRTSVVMATGGPGMVKAAYSSGKPTLAVGAGNVPCYVHKSKAGQIGEVAEQIITSKCFDYGTACVSEQAVIADKQIARELRHEMKMRGAYFMTPQEAASLAKVIFTGRQAMNPENVGQSPQVLSAKAGFSIPPRTRCLVSDEAEIGWQRPLSAEKLNPVLAFYDARDEAHGLELSFGIAKFEGWGHSAVIHSDDPTVVTKFSAIPVGRVLVNTPAIMGGMGYSTALEPSFMLGTGTWSGSITSDNVTALHLINIKRVAYENRPWRDIYEEYGE
ncbi:MAG: aldehyde dehydrogenase family protein [Hoeflea sp.]|uniref:aldehyde dehydrogenase family protein n=1 Tax=Hoeflea sp. TaxID=1940281 RepID=UPI00272F02E9|nr:aldehyde dehydrogenase family protein [Hoeflea sp.]MDP2122703.1 aldehyde dehydrogenase family protein [Hoeflea sp.]MDP3525309.1 aldehyde dehydrogenase family protein [Hoeflea sp.]MDZ7600349.1 aldehyde dehydrogenase family protein [Hoeflea sp.]